jgi:exopolysaccharide biosynthesis protein
MQKLMLAFIFCITLKATNAQLNWRLADSAFGNLPQDFHVYFSNDSLNRKPFIGYYTAVPINHPTLKFAVDTTNNRRLTPSQFFEKNNNPLLVVNTTFFSFQSNRNVSPVVINNKIVAHTNYAAKAKGRDSLSYIHIPAGVINFSSKMQPNIGWVLADSNSGYSIFFDKPVEAIRDNEVSLNRKKIRKLKNNETNPAQMWNTYMAVGGGPVLLQNGDVLITNNQEQKFAGKAINDKHPRTLIGYTKSHIIVMVIEGRNKGIAEGATLYELATIMKDLGCIEALNLDGGGSSCMLINGKPTIKVSDKEGQRAVPCVLLVHSK